MNNFRKCFYLFVIAILFISVKDASAKFISEEEARVVIENWLKITPSESLGFKGTEIREVMRFESGRYGNPGYYLALLEQDGWVIVPGDDGYEAIIAFGEGSFSREEYELSPLADFLSVNADLEDALSQPSALSDNRDNAQESDSVKAAINGNSAHKQARADRWKTLSTPIIKNNDGYGGDVAADNKIPDRVAELNIAVEPILGSNTWSQGYLNGLPYYNFHTLWDIAPEESHRFPVGHGAVATAQLMSVFKHPSISPKSGDILIGTPFENTITVQGDVVGFRVLEDLTDFVGTPVLRTGTIITLYGDIIVEDEILPECVIIKSETPSSLTVELLEGVIYNDRSITVTIRNFRRITPLIVHNARIKGGTAGKQNRFDPNVAVGYDWDFITPEIKIGVHDQDLSDDGMSDSHTDRIRHEIASLLYDVGVLLGSAYTKSETKSVLDDVPKILKDNLYYQSAFYHPMAYNNNITPATIKNLQNRINPNLDFGVPVILGTGTKSGEVFTDAHIFVVDGYSYHKTSEQNEPEYYHLNMEWEESPSRGFWYNLTNMPVVASQDSTMPLSSDDEAPSPFIGIVFNVMPESKDVELITGRLAISEDFKPSLELSLKLEGINDPLITKVKENGGFAFSVPSGSKISDVVIIYEDETGQLESNSILENFVKAGLSTDVGTTDNLGDAEIGHLETGNQYIMIK